MAICVHFFDDARFRIRAVKPDRTGPRLMVCSSCIYVWQGFSPNCSFRHQQHIVLNWLLRRDRTRQITETTQHARDFAVLLNKSEKPVASRPTFSKVFCKIFFAL